MVVAAGFGLLCYGLGFVLGLLWYFLYLVMLIGICLIWFVVGVCVLVWVLLTLLVGELLFWWFLLLIGWVVYLFDC